MAGAIGDINQGLVGISHTTGTEHLDVPAKKMSKPRGGSTITVHTESALNLEDSGNHLMKFIRGERLDSYSPQDQKDLRNSVIKTIKEQSKQITQMEPEAEKHLQAIENLMKKDEELELAAMMAKNVLISA